MNRHTLALAVGTLLAATAVAQPPPDHTPSRSRKFTLPIEFDAEKRKTIQQVQLLVSRDQGQTWEVHDAVTPDKDHFNLTAKDDGTYWMTMVIRHTDGKSDPADLTKLAPTLKYLIDATPPVVRLPVANRDGDDVVLEWTVDDKYPNDPATVVSYKGTAGDWQPVPADAVVKRTARFKPAVPGPVTVRVSVQDSGGNPAQIMKELPAGTTAAYSPQLVVPATANQSGGLGTPQLPVPVLPGNSLPPPSLPPPSLPLTTGPSAPGPVVPAAPVAPAPLPPATPPPPMAATPVAPAPVPPTWTPPPPATPAPDIGPSPIATSGGTAPAFSPAPAAPPPDTGPVQHIRFTQFQLQYQLDAGPSGVRQIDLYVTRDDGRSWTRWSQHDGKENPMRVNLGNRGGAPADGDYGFKLVSVSNANLSDDIPAPGTPPDVRVRVDTTPPLISVFPIEADLANRNAVVIKWKAADLNLSETSTVSIDWSDSPTGQWRPVGGPDAGAVNPTPGAVGRIPNRGSYSWQLPANLPSHLIYFRFTAVDPAGNRSEVVTPPQTVDLVRPRARIQSVVTATVPR